MILLDTPCFLEIKTETNYRQEYQLEETVQNRVPRIHGHVDLRTRMSPQGITHILKTLLEALRKQDRATTFAVLLEVVDPSSS